jgi:histidine phosphotransferase ChpT
MRVLELLMARLCHELSAPIAAINNGVELLAEEDADAAPSGTSFVRDAAALIGDSARRAGKRLQFYRFAYGFGRSAAIAGPPPHELAVNLFDASRIACNYSDSVRVLPLDWQKLACNLLSIGAETLPRGGGLTITDGPLSLEAIGEAAALSPDTRAALMLATPIADLTSRTAHGFFTGLLAQALGCRLISAAEPGRVRLSVVATSA